MTRASPKASQNGRGILLMLAAMACFGANDTIIKVVTTDVPLFQALSIRGVCFLTLLGAVAVARGGFPLRVVAGDRRVMVVRTLAEVVSSLLFLSALVRMPLANVVAIMQALPIVIMLGAALVFRERIGWRRAVAGAVGFAGVLMIVQPGADGFSLWSVATLAAMLAVAARDLSSRALSEATTGLTVTFYSAASVLGIALLAMPFQGVVPISAGHVGLLALAAGFVMVAFLLIVAASRTGEIALVAPFRYSAMLWGLLAGWLVFGQLPGLLTLVGATVVIGSGLFMLWREHLQARRQAVGGVAGQGGAVDNPPSTSYTPLTRRAGVTPPAGIAAGVSSDGSRGNQT